MTPVVYEMDAIGEGGALEAVAVHAYCSPECQAKHGLTGSVKLAEQDQDHVGLLCESCNRPLGAVNLAPITSVSQGDFIPGQPDTLIVATINTEDIRNVAADNGYVLTEEQAQAMLEANSCRLVDAFLHEWTQVLWDVCYEEIEAKGEPLVEEEESADKKAVHSEEWTATYMESLKIGRSEAAARARADEASPVG